MSLFSSKKKRQPTRREVLTQRRAISSKESEVTSQAPTYRSNRSLRSKAPKIQDGQPDRQASWDIKKRRRKALSMLGVVVFLGLGTALMLYQLTAYVVIETADMRSQAGSAKYVKIFEDYLSKRPAERLRFAVDDSALHEYFLETAPEVKTIRVASGGKLATTKLQLSFRKPVVQWTAAGKAYYVDDTGVTFETSYYEDPGVMVNDQSGIIPQAGHEIVDKKFLGFLGQSVSGFESKGFKVAAVILPVDTIRQVEFSIDGLAYRIKVTVDRGAEAQVQQAIHAIKYMKSSGRQPEYIDVRTNKQVFYK